MPNLFHLSLYLSISISFHASAAKILHTSTFSLSQNFNPFRLSSSNINRYFAAIANCINLEVVLLWNYFAQTKSRLSFQASWK